MSLSIASDPKAIRTMDPADIKKLIHELSVHQIELEMQNEEIRQGQIELQEARDKYLDLYDFAPTGYFTLDHNSLILDANLAGSELLGSEKHRLIGTQFTASISPDSQDAFYLHYREVLKTGSKGNCELKMLKADGTPFHAQLITMAIPEKDGSINHCKIAVIDITERKLEEAEMELRAHLLNNATDSIVLHDFEGNFIYINEAAYKTRGYKKDELMAINLHALDTPEYAKLIGPRIEYMIVHGEVTFESVHVNKNGSVVPVEIHAQILNINGKKQIISVIRDITERKQAQDDLQRSLEQVNNAIGQTIQAMSNISEVRDPYTAGHQRRVAQLSTKIAIEMGLSKAQIDGIRTAAFIHDIGKIGIPAEILSKPGKLTMPEFDMMRSHSRTGHDILDAIDFPWPIAQIVLQHHERMDGSGYPDGLIGEKISPEARIIAVADVVEAISSHRPYRPGGTIESALLEIIQQRGKLYDSDAVQACENLIMYKGFKFSTVV